jgi:orotate phosphoribosyltransferase
VTPQPLPVLDIFRQTEAYLTGHFRLTSGLHSPEYLQCAKVLQYPWHAETLGRALADALTSLLSDSRPDFVIAPAMGGLIIGHEVARAFNVPFLFTEREASGSMTLRRGFFLASGQKCVVIEDVVTTGGSTREVVEIVRAAGAVPLAAGSIIDRSGGSADVGIPRVALATLKATTYPPDDCPLCQQGVEVVKPGSRK